MREEAAKKFSLMLRKFVPQVLQWRSFQKFQRSSRFLVYHPASAKICFKHLSSDCRVRSSASNEALDSFSFPKTLETTAENEERISAQSFETLNSKDADAICQILLEQHNPYHIMEASMQLNGIRMCPELVRQVMLRLKNASKIAMGFFTWAGQQAGYRHDSSTFNVMIDILGRVRQFDVAWQLVMELGQMQPQMQPQTFAILIRRYIAAGMSRQAIRTFDDMESFTEKVPCLDDFHFLLDTLCKYGCVKVATELFNKRKDQFERDAKGYTIIISGWCKFNKPEMARKFLSEMVNKGIRPMTVTYNILLDHAFRKTRPLCEKQFRRVMQVAGEILDEMKSSDCSPDVVTYSILMHAFGRSLRSDRCFKLLQEMKDAGCQPNVATYTSLVRCLCVSGRFSEAYAILDEMEQKGISPSAVTYNCFFRELAGRDQVEEVLRLYHRMLELPSCRPTNHTYNMLIRMFCRLDRMEIVHDLWNDMRQVTNGPDLDSYTILIHCLCDNARWKEACIYFTQMIERGFLPQTVTFRTLYRGLIQADKMRTWRRLKFKLMQESVKVREEFEGYHFEAYRR